MAGYAHSRREVRGRGGEVVFGPQKQLFLRQQRTKRLPHVTRLDK